jgi:hypothetical protein
MGSDVAGWLAPDTVPLNKSKKTLLHTQASDQMAPRKRGLLFSGAHTNFFVVERDLHFCPVGPLRSVLDLGYAGQIEFMRFEG